MGEISDSNDYEYSTSDDDAEYSWIGWFCSRKGHEFLCEVSAGGKCGEMFWAARAGVAKPAPCVTSCSDAGTCAGVVPQGVALAPWNRPGDQPGGCSVVKR